MRVNIVYELNNREFNHCVLLQREMIRRGYDARIYNKTESMVLSNKESITIIPNSYRKGDVDYYRYVFNTRNHLVVVYPCEQINNHQLESCKKIASSLLGRRLLSFYSVSWI